MHGAVVATQLWQLLPLAASAQAKDAAIEPPALTAQAMPLGLGGLRALSPGSMSLQTSSGTSPMSGCAEVSVITLLVCPTRES
jgi:hypothetical protein